MVLLDKVLNTIYRVVEALTVMGVFGMVAYLLTALVFHDTASPQYFHALSLVQTVNDNWKAFLLLAVLLFFRTVRSFFERVEEAWGMKAKPVPAGTPDIKPNAPTQK